jgi:hypothetical protein
VLLPLAGPLSGVLPGVLHVTLDAEFARHSGAALLSALDSVHFP